MRPADAQITADLIAKLNSFQNIRATPGINAVASRDCLVRQMVDSVRRIRYVQVIRNKHLDNSVCDPNSIAFDPIKASAWNLNNGNIEEASWLVFLATHFGKNLRTKWKLVANVYGALGQQAKWDWNNVSGNIQGFRNWLDQNSAAIKNGANFGNHRKYESINGLQSNGTGEAVATYVAWVTNSGNHQQLFQAALVSNNNDSKQAFAHLYNAMNGVARFGRTAKFDYLTMMGKLGITNIEPDSTYMNGSTGPYSGAKLLFGSTETQATFNQWLNDLEAHLGLYFGMQILEDSLCNWQKSPNNYVYFGG